MTSKTLTSKTLTPAERELADAAFALVTLSPLTRDRVAAVIAEVARRASALPVLTAESAVVGRARAR